MIEPNTGASDTPVWPPQVRRLLFIVWTVFWVIMMATALQDYWRDGGREYWKPLLWEGSSALVATLILLVQYRYALRNRAWLATPSLWFYRHMRWLPLLCVFFVAAIYGIRHSVYYLLGLEYTHEGWGPLFIYESLKIVVLFSLWQAVFYSLESTLLTKQQQDQLHELQQAYSETQLQQLRAQLNPHFLFNTLNMISAFITINPEHADVLLNKLADLLRASLAMDTKRLVPLADDMAILRQYGEIMQERFGERVSLHWDIADDCLSLLTPPMLMQPLLENAFKHAVEKNSQAIAIQVKACRVQDKLQLIVRNDGELPAVLGECIGLGNVRRRLQALWAGQASFDLRAESAGDGKAQVVAEILLPITLVAAAS